jgi:hypothetical protein
METRKINATRHSNGNTGTSGTNNSRAHMGTGFGTLGRTSWALCTGIRA